MRFLRTYMQRQKKAYPLLGRRRHRDSAKCEEAGGIDLMVIYNSGRYRMAGRASIAGLFAYGDANAIVNGNGGRGFTGCQKYPRASRCEWH